MKTQSARNQIPSPTIIHGSSESMRAIEDQSVSLTITSPPYHNAMNYEKYEPNTKKHKSRDYGKGFSSYEEYLSMMQRVFTEVYRVTKPGGFCAIIVGNIQDSGKCIPIPWDLSHRMQQIGWSFHQHIVWSKAMSVLDRAGVLVQHPYPGYFYPNCMHEFVMVFSRPGEKIYKQADETQRSQSRIDMTSLVKRDVLNDIWCISPEKNGSVDHPCPYPPELPHRLCMLYSHVGDLVLDPFVGSGTTGQVAHALSRRFVGYEIEKQFVEIARHRVTQPLKLRSKQLVLRTESIEHDPFVCIDTHDDPPSSD